MKSGIYQITNITNNHRYIGSSSNLNRRWYTHKTALRKNRHHSIYLQRAWNKYSEASFQFTILELVESVNLFEREQYYIDTIKPEYNLGSVGGGDNISKHPKNAEFRKKQSRVQKERYSKFTTEQTQQLRDRYKKQLNPNWKGGKTYFTCPVCNKEIRVSVSGQQTCQVCRDINGSKNPFFGKHHSNDTKTKISNSRKGMKPSNTRKITIDGVEYQSQNDAAKALGVSAGLISYRIKRGIYTATSNDNLS